MTTQEKLVRRKQSLLELAEYLQNISQACKISGVSRQHFYDIKKAYDEHGLEGLREKSRRKPCIKNRVVPEVEEAVVSMAYEYPAYGQTRVANELRKRGMLVSVGGIRSIWVRHGLETFKEALKSFGGEGGPRRDCLHGSPARSLGGSEARAGVSSHEIETEHPGYLVSQDTFYV
jgi:transposase